MTNLTSKELTELIISKLQEIDEKVQVEEPTIESIFPLKVVQTPLESVTKTQNGEPILKTFQVNVEHWSSNKYEMMQMATDTDIKLQECNFIRTKTIPDVLDEQTSKYKLITTYEVQYNYLTNSLNFIK